MGTWRKHVVFFSLILMLCGVLFSRVLLSSGMIVFIAACLIHNNLVPQIKIFFGSPFLWSMSLLFLLPLVSGLWSENISQWFEVLRIKLPLLLLPFSFAGIRDFRSSDWEKIAFAFILLAFSGICWSVWLYLQDLKSIHEGYLQAHTIDTPLGNDHVRFSLFIAIAILTTAFLLIKFRRSFSKPFSILLIFGLAVFVVYLHLLAVRTGLLCFYFGSLVCIIALLLKRKDKWKYVLALLGIVLLPFLFYFTLPTLKNRISYLKYDLGLVQKNIYLHGSNDGNRVISLKAGWELLNQKPFTGVGFGDVKDEADRYYVMYDPQRSPTDMILPSSEWIMYGAGVGLPGFILFTFCMLIPFFLQRLRSNIAWSLLNSFMAISYLFDIGLEVQFGVFIHAFVLLWWYKWLQLQQ